MYTNMNQTYPMIYTGFDLEFNNSHKHPCIVKLAKKNLVDFSRAIKFLRKMDDNNYFPKIAHCGFFIHEADN